MDDRAVCNPLAARKEGSVTAPGSLYASALPDPPAVQDKTRECHSVRESLMPDFATHSPEVPAMNRIESLASCNHLAVTKSLFAISGACTSEWYLEFLQELH